MPFNQLSGLKIFQFRNLSQIPWIGHAVSTRDFGDVKNSREKFFKTIGVKEKDVADAQQVHGNHVAIVDGNERGHVILETDALITNTPHVILLIKVADCVPIMLVDSVHKVIGAVHAGWRGTVQEITRLTVQHMEDHFGTNPTDVIVGIGPSIGPCCYEVDTPVIEAFKKFSYADQLFTQKRNNHTYLNLWLANRFQLIEIGVKEKNIEVAERCTLDNTRLFFSERAEGKTGRIGAVIWIKNNPAIQF